MFDADRILTKSEFEDIHPFGGGIYLDKGKVKSIKIIRRPHPFKNLNMESEDHIEYAPSPSHMANSAMRAAMEGQLSVRVVAFDIGKGEGYDRGLWQITGVSTKCFRLLRAETNEMQDTDQIQNTTKSTEETTTEELHDHYQSPPIVQTASTPIVASQSPFVQIPAKKTLYQGTLYRSRLEARWSFFMDVLEVPHTYERVSFDLSSGRYTPDFWLLQQKCFVEIKPAFPHQEALNKCEEVAALGFDIVLLGGDVGLPFLPESGGRTYAHKNCARGIGWSADGLRVGVFVWQWREGRAILEPALDRITRGQACHQNLVNAFETTRLKQW